MRVMYLVLVGVLLFSCTSSPSKVGLEYDFGGEIESIIFDKISDKGIALEDLLIIANQESDTLVLSLMNKQKVGTTLQNICINSERYFLIKEKKIPILSNEDLLYANGEPQSENEEIVVQPPWSGNDLELYFDENKKLINEVKGE